MNIDVRHYGKLQIAQQTFPTLRTPPLVISELARGDGEERLYDGDGSGEQVIYTCPWKGGARDGTATYFHNNQRIHIITFVRGRRNGAEIIYYRNGSKLYEASWKDDALSGIVRWFSPDGQLLYDSEFSRGRRVIGGFTRAGVEANRIHRIIDTEDHNTDMVIRLLLHIITEPTSTGAAISATASSSSVSSMSGLSQTPPTTTSSLANGTGRSASLSPRPNITIGSSRGAAVAAGGGGGGGSGFIQARPSALTHAGAMTPPISRSESPFNARLDMSNVAAAASLTPVASHSPHATPPSSPIPHRSKASTTSGGSGISAGTIEATAARLGHLEQTRPRSEESSSILASLMKGRIPGTASAQPASQPITINFDIPQQPPTPSYLSSSVPQLPLASLVPSSSSTSVHSTGSTNESAPTNGHRSTLLRAVSAALALNTTETETPAVAAASAAHRAVSPTRSPAISPSHSPPSSPTTQARRAALMIVEDDEVDEEDIARLPPELQETGGRLRRLKNSMKRNSGVSEAAARAARVKANSVSERSESTSRQRK